MAGAREMKLKGSAVHLEGTAVKINTYHCSVNNPSGPFYIHSAAGFVCRHGSANLFKKLSSRNVSLHLILQRFNFASLEFQTRFEISYLEHTLPKYC